MGTAGRAGPRRATPGMDGGARQHRRECGGGTHLEGCGLGVGLLWASRSRRGAEGARSGAEGLRHAAEGELGLGEQSSLKSAERGMGVRRTPLERGMVLLGRGELLWGREFF